MNLNLDWSFFSWDLFSNFVLKGLYFSVSLTVIATLGGIFFGTLLALMRLSTCLPPSMSTACAPSRW